jgi:calcineurin-like phosphoesterase family protein
MTIFAISDTHIGHKNVLKYSGRPFKTIEEHDEALVNNWNGVVGDSDCVYHLGDVGLCEVDYLARVLKRLKGNIFLIKGNHDDNIEKYPQLKSRFVWIKDLHFLKLREEKQAIMLCHYAMKTWRNSHHGSWHLYGHSHGTLPEDQKSLSFDVGVDCWGYTPVSLEQIKNKMLSKLPTSSYSTT